MAKTIYLCRGSDCKKRKSANKRLRSGLEGTHQIEEVRCQKICKGPVVGVKVEGTLHWFRKLDVKHDLVELQKTVARDRMTKGLASKQATKRTGKFR